MLQTLVEDRELRRWRHDRRRTVPQDGACDGKSTTAHINLWRGHQRTTWIPSSSTNREDRYIDRAQPWVGVDAVYLKRYSLRYAQPAKADKCAAWVSYVRSDGVGRQQQDGVQTDRFWQWQTTVRDECLSPIRTGYKSVRFRRMLSRAFKLFLPLRQKRQCVCPTRTSNDVIGDKDEQLVNVSLQWRRRQTYYSQRLPDALTFDRQRRQPTNCMRTSRLDTKRTDSELQNDVDVGANVLSRRLSRRLMDSRRCCQCRELRPRAGFPFGNRPVRSTADNFFFYSPYGRKRTSMLLSFDSHVDVRFNCEDWLHGFTTQKQFSVSRLSDRTIAKYLKYLLQPRTWLFSSFHGQRSRYGNRFANNEDWRHSCPL